MTKVPSPRELQILACAQMTRSGRDIAKLIEAETGERMSYGTLYTTVHRMAKREPPWVEVQDKGEGDARVRWIRCTRAGKKALTRGRDYYLSLSTFRSLGLRET